MNIYQCLVNIGKAPDECIGKNSVIVFKSEDGELGVGFYGKLLAPKGKSKAFKPAYRTKLEVDMLGITPDYLLSLIKELHRVAKEKGIEVKGVKIEEGE